MAPSDFAKRATRGYAWNYLYKLSEFGLTNVFSILVIRRFGPEISGPYAIFIALATILAMLGSFAVDGILLRYINRIANNSPAETESFENLESLSLPHFLNSLLAFRLTITSIIALIVVVVLIILPSIDTSIAASLGSMTMFAPYLLIYIFAQGINAFSTFSLTGLLESRRVFYSSIVAKSILLATGLLLVIGDGLTLERAIAVYVGSGVFGAAFVFYSLRKEVASRYHSITTHRFTLWQLLKSVKIFLSKPKHITSFLATPLLLYGITTWGNDMLSIMLGKQPDVLTMKAILGEGTSQIGYYFAATQILLITEYIFLFGLGGTLVSIFSGLAHDDEAKGNSYESLAKARREVGGFQNVVLLPLAVFVFFFTPLIVKIIYGVQYEAATDMVRWGMMALLISVGLFGGGMQITSLVAIGKERLVFRNRLSWGIGNFVLNIVLIYFFGGLGALIGTQYCNAGACANEAYFASKYIGKAMNYRSTLRILIISLIGALIPYLCFSYLVQVPIVISLCISGIADAVIVLLLYQFFKIDEREIVVRRLRSLLSK